MQADDKGVGIMFHIVRSHKDIERLMHNELRNFHRGMELPSDVLVSLKDLDLNSYMGSKKVALASVMLDEPAEIEFVITFCTVKEAKRVIYPFTNKSRNHVNNFFYVENSDQAFKFVNDTASEIYDAGGFLYSEHGKLSTEARNFCRSLQEAEIRSFKRSMGYLVAGSFPALITVVPHHKRGCRITSFDIVTKLAARSLVYFHKNGKKKKKIDAWGEQPVAKKVTNIANKVIYHSYTPGIHIRMTSRPRFVKLTRKATITAELVVDHFRKSPIELNEKDEFLVRQAERARISVFNHQLSSVAFDSIDDAIKHCSTLINSFLEFSKAMRKRAWQEGKGGNAL
jgi:hypothetical protein